MSRPREHGERSQTIVRLPVELHERLMAESEDRDLAANVLMTKFIADGLDRLVPVDELLRTR